MAHWIKLFGSTENEAVDGNKLPDDSISQRLAPEPSLPAIINNTAKEVMKVISEITGYPPEMIEENMEIESDLGIDTVKQATILSTLSERFGMTDKVDFKISAYPTVGHLIKLFSNETVPMEQNRSTVSSAVIEKPINKENERIIPVQTHVLEFMRNDPNPAVIDLSSLSLWVLCDDNNKCDSIVNYFKPLFRTVEVKQIGSVGEISGGADVWIDLGIFDVETDSPKSSIDKNNLLHKLLGSRFDFCKKCGEHLPQRILLCRTLNQNAWNSLLQGFYQSVAKEWKAHFSAIEVKQAATVEDYWPFVETELRTKSDGIRIVYDNEERHIQKIVPSQLNNSLQKHQNSLDNSDVILVTGGGNGITSRIAIEMASKFPAKFVIIGRSELSSDDYTADKWGPQNINNRKEELKDQIVRSGKRATPALIDKALSSALRQRELQLTLKKISGMGRELEYMSCDITDFKRLKECFAKVNQKWGKISGILHGAGFEKSQLLSKKNRNDFFNVVDVKVLGALYLLDLCPIESLKMWISMSSISGVFGNEAQTDYSSANAFLNGIAEDIAIENKNVKSLALAWSGWSDLGMAWRNTFVRENAQSMGLFLIPPSDGADAAVNVLTSDISSSVYIIHRGLGAMLTKDWKPEITSDTPLLEKIEFIDNNTLRAFKTITIETDEWINQHRLQDVPLVPGVAMMEIMAETFAHTCQIKNGVKFENVSFHDALKLYKKQPREVYVETQDIYTNNQKMRIYSQFTSKVVKKPEIRDYCAAVVSTVNNDAPFLDKNLWNIDNPQKMFYEELLHKLYSIPNNVVFGPLFHDSKRADYIANTDWIEWNNEIIHTMHSFPMEQLTNTKYHLRKYIFNFCLLDSIHQTGVIHTILNSGEVHLPFSAREFVVFGKQEKNGTYQTYAKLVEKSDKTFVYDIYLIDPQENVCAYALGSTYHRIQG